MLWQESFHSSCLLSVTGSILLQSHSYVTIIVCQTKCKLFLISQIRSMIDIGSTPHPNSSHHHDFNLFSRGSRTKPSIGPRKKPSYFPLYWLVNKDPYNGLLQSLYNWVVFHPLYNPTNQGPFFRHKNWEGIRTPTQDRHEVQKAEKFHSSHLP